MGWQDIHGWFDFGNIYDEAVTTAQKGGVIVEIGVAFGRSLAYLAESAKDRPDLALYGVDPWIVDRGPRQINVEGWGGMDHADRIASAGGPYRFFLRQMSMHAPDALERVRALRLTSVEASRLFDDASIDLAFIDGDHKFASVSEDIRTWWPKVRPGGMLAGHDWPNYESVREAVKGQFAESQIELSRSSWMVRKEGV